MHASTSGEREFTGTLRRDGFRPPATRHSPKPGDPCLTRPRTTARRPRFPLSTRPPHELEPEAGRLLDRHLKVAQEWFPHEFIPYRLGRDFDKEPWTPDQPRLTGVAQTAFEIGLLTEDNLPSYHRLIHGMFGKGDGAWLNWVGRWTAEEGRHAIVLRDYLTVTRNIDPIALERGRMTQLQQGYDHEPRTRSTGWRMWRSRSWRRGSRTGTRAATRTTRWRTRSWSGSRTDENLHMVFYRDILKAAIQLDPSAAVRAIVDEVLAFQMPGAGIPGFIRKAAQIAKAGIYDLRVHRDEVLMPILRYWGVFELSGLDAAAEEARRRLAEHLEKLDGPRDGSRSGWRARASRGLRPRASAFGSSTAGGAGHVGWRRPAEPRASPPPRCRR